jgi:N-acetyl-anhydromuramyl-L-alanine amidase AmpD
MNPVKIALDEGTRPHPNVVVKHKSPNQSDRKPVPLDLIVLHDTEGANIAKSAKDLEGLGNFFAQSSVEASSHVATDGDGNSARFVSDDRKAWHCAAFNSASLGIEQIGFAKQSHEAWMKRWPQLHETARWIAHWSHRHDIPIRRAEVSDERVTRSGVIRHMDLGVPGGNHADPGEHFPFNHVLELARLFKALHPSGEDQ